MCSKYDEKNILKSNKDVNHQFLPNYPCENKNLVRIGEEPNSISNEHN